VSFSPRGKKTQGIRREPGRKANLFQAVIWQAPDWKLEWLKKSHSCSDAREMESWSISDQREITISGGEASSWATQIHAVLQAILWPDPSNPGDHGPGSMRCIGGSKPLEAVGLVQYLARGRDPDQPVNVSETSCGGHGFSGPSTRSHAHGAR